MLEFSDFRIVPQLTHIRTRAECNTSVQLGPYTLSVPLIVASMHSLVTQEMVHNIDSHNSIVVQPRNTYFHSTVKRTNTETVYSAPLALSAGFNNAIERARGIRKNGILSIEVANGYQRRMLQVIHDVRSVRPDLFIMAGTVCDVDGYDFLADHADGVLMGIGVGSACTTTINTGVGLPGAEMLSRLFNDDIMFDDRAKVILCGGVRTYGDFVKALALGADVVMSGYFFKDCADAGGRYYGEASEHQKGELEYVEGTEIPVAKTKQTSAEILLKARHALQSAMSYSDSRTIDEFRAKVRLTR